MASVGLPARVDIGASTFTFAVADAVSAATAVAVDVVVAHRSFEAVTTGCRAWFSLACNPLDLLGTADGALAF